VLLFFKFVTCICGSVSLDAVKDAFYRLSAFKVFSYIIY
jgi:hypothetical protein